MLEYISDSDEEIPSLTLNVVSASDIYRVLVNLPIEFRRGAAQTLKNSRFAHLFEEIEQYDNESISNENINNDNDNNNNNSNNNNDKYLEIMYPITNNNEITASIHPLVEETRDGKTQDYHEQIENSSRLQAFLELSKENSIRRSLRKRKFSSTHPYLADQAHWLGLANIEHLNQMHDQDADVETIVKYLNKIYMKRKRAYPKEEKYKAKNFYAFLGKGKTKELQPIEDSSQQSMSYSTSQLNKSEIERVSDYPDDDEEEEDEERDYDSEEPVLPPKNRLHKYKAQDEYSYEPHIFSQDSDLELINLNKLNETSNLMETDEIGDSDSNLSDNFIRVGGRYRREKNVLRGLLPESAKRTAIYKPVRRKNNKNDSKRVEYRKGLAIKKSCPKRNHDEIDLYNFVDDKSDFLDDPVQYLSFNAENDSTTTPIFDRLTELSDYYTSEVSDYDTEYVKRPSIDFSKRTDTIFKPRAEKPLFSHQGERIIDLTSEEDDDYITNNKRANINTTQWKPKRKIIHRSKINRRKGYGKLKKKKIQGRLKNHNKPKVTKSPLATRKNYKKDLESRYTFARNPIQSTLIYEAESSDKFVKTSYNQKYRKESELPFLKSKQKFPPGFILHDIEIDKIWKLLMGNVLFFNVDELQISLMNEKFYFLVVNKDLSSSNCNKILNYLSIIFRDTSKLTSDNLNELYVSIRDLIKWALIIQEPISDNNLQALEKLLHHLTLGKSISDAGTKTKVLPYLILFFRINMIFVNRLALEDNVKLEENFNKYCNEYWKMFLINFKLDEVTKTNAIENSHSFESVYLMHLLFQRKDEWWKCINNALVDLLHVGDISTKFDLLFFLASMVSSKDSDWTCFYTIFQECKNDEDSYNHDNFMQIICALHDKFSWPFEEKLMTTLYSSVTARKFGNFEDEIVEPELLSNVRSRYDIPSDTFFESFMQLLYIYVSELPIGFSKKRLITKMFTSSNYHYEKGREYYIMFINRLNFVLLLTKLSDVDLKNQLHNLVLQIRDSNNIGIFEKMVRGLGTYTEISIEKGNLFPYESFTILGQKFMDLYTSEPGYLKLWTKFLKVVKKFILKTSSFVFGKLRIEILQFFLKLDINTTLDQISFEVCSLAREFLDELIPQRTILIGNTSAMAMISNYQKKNIKLLNMHMGRFPLSESINKYRIEKIIEDCFKIWINCTNLSSDQNWNILVLQHFPYIGNSFLRAKFGLYFYNELLKVANLDYCIDIIISAVMSEFAALECSKYLPLIIQTITNSETIKRTYSNYFKDISTFQVLNFRLKTVADIVKRISNDKSTPFSTKKSFIDAYLRALEKNFYEFYQVNEYAEFCKSLIRVIEANCLELIKSNESFLSLCNKLEISFSSIQNSWINLSWKDKLVFIHNELSTSVMLNKDYISSLDKYILPQFIDIPYHLLSIYAKAVIISKQKICWNFVCCILRYIYVKLSNHNIPVSDGTFKSLLLITCDLSHIAEKYKTPDVSYYCYLTRYYVYSIYLNAYLILDGFKDKHFLVSLLDNVLNLTKNDSYEDYFISSYSQYNFVDIHLYNSDHNIQLIEYLESETLSVKESCDNCYNTLNLISRSSLNATDEILSFEL